MNIAARRAPALAVLLRDLVGAEALLLLGVEIVADAELRLARGLQIDLPHRIVGTQSRDMERAALAVIFAVEFGIVLRALEVGQHVGIGPAGVAERGPVVVIAAVAADIDHGVDRGRAAEPLAARLIADAPVEACLRHGIERPVVDLAGDHQDHRARRGDHPIVVLAAGLQQRHRRFGILGKPARDRAAAGAAAHHHKIECVRHAHPPSLSRPAHGPGCWSQGWAFAQVLARAPDRRFWRDMSILAVIKSSKVGLQPFPKRTRVGTYPPRPKGFAKGCLLRKPPDGIDRRPLALAKSVSAFGFSEGAQGLSRGGAAR